MKSLIKKIFKNKLAIYFRNLLNIYPVKINTNLLVKNYSISDSFIWRTDNNFKTIFKFSDILNLFYGDKACNVDLKFYSKEGTLLKDKKNLNINLCNSLIIDKKFMNDIEDYGTFSIHHTTQSNHFSIRNSCYTGFSYNNRSYIYVHGNVPATAQHFNNSKNKLIKGLIGKTLFLNQTYKIQNNFGNCDYTELFIHNPCKSTINFIVDDEKYKLKSDASLIIKIVKQEIEIRSNCYLLRPIIFNYKLDTIDVFHG